MKRFTFVLVAVSSLFYSFSVFGFTQSFSGIGIKTMEQTWTELKSVGLFEMDPWDPRLPHPQVPALKAVVSSRVGLLAYFDEEIYGWGTNLVFKNPNGSYRHSVFYSRDAIKFVTPYQGTVAHANRYMTVDGPGYNFYCQRHPVTEFAFYQCVDSLFIKVIVNQLKQYVD